MGVGVVFVLVFVVYVFGWSVGYGWIVVVVFEIYG